MDKFQAARNGDLDWFLQRPHTVLEDFNGRCTLIEASVQSKNFKLLEYFLSKGVPVDQPSVNGWTALISACTHGNIDMVNLLLSKGANPNIVTKNRHSALGETIWGTPYEKLEIRRALLLAGADPTIEVGTIKDICNVVFNGSDTSILELVLEFGYDINERDGRGYSMLLNAAAHNNLNITQILLSKGAIIDIPAKDGKTPLHCAATNWEGNCDVLKLLLANGADHTLTDENGWTPYEYARHEKYYGQNCAKHIDVFVKTPRSLKYFVLRLKPTTNIRALLQWNDYDKETQNGSS